MKYTLYTLGLLIVFSSCNKVLTDYNKEFEGTWFSEAQYNSVMGKFVSDELVISGNAGTYQSDCKDTCVVNLCDCTNKITGKAEINDKRTIIRLNSQIKRTFFLQQEPYEIDGKWFMKLDGKVYQKQ